MDIPDIQTIGILAGIFFLFIAIIGGGLTIRGVVIPKIPKWMRVLAFLLGLILVFFWPVFLHYVYTPSQLPATVSISSSPSGAGVYLDNRDYKGLTPVTLPNIEPGSHTIILKLAGYDDWAQTILLSSEQTHYISASLTQASVTPTLIITPEPKITTPSSTITPTLIITPEPKITTPSSTITPLSGMEFVLIPAGEFDMGSPSNEVGRDDDEGPVHHVKLAKAFYMGKYEVTQKQWSEIMGNNPSYFKGNDLPVESVSWSDVQQFIKKLNEKEGTNKYRLPSEAEWEYTVRAGETSRYSFGDDESTFGDYAWYDSNSNGKTHPVGQKNPNSWGLYDMYGNVREWVQDSYHSSYNGAPTDGSVWEDGSVASRVSRGGSWHGYANNSRSASRNSYDPAGNYNHVGFRLLKDL